MPTKKNTPQRQPGAPADELANLLAAVLNHPDLPGDLEDAIGEGLNDLFNNLPNRRWKQIEYSPAYVSLLLSTHKDGSGAMTAKQKKVAPDPSGFANFGDYLARVIMHPRTPAALKSALQAVVVNTMSNESGYSWADDEAGLRFLIPLFLSHMADDYATGIMHATGEMIAGSLPGELRRELMEGGAR
jgi:hypothetical protein